LLGEKAGKKETRRTPGGVEKATATDPEKGIFTGFSSLNCEKEKGNSAAAAAVTVATTLLRWVALQRLARLTGLLGLDSVLLPCLDLVST